MDTVETIEINDNVRVRIEYDTDPPSPVECDNLGEIAYSSSRYCLGTEDVSQERLREIHEKIESGEYLGLPVYAYVHSGATIRCGSGFSCPWDSGQSGFVYCTKEKAIAEFGKRVLTKKVKEKALNCLRAEVEVFDQYLTGDVYGIIVETRAGEDDEWEEKESCWGFYGIDCARDEAQREGEYVCAALHNEAVEKQYWEYRGVMTAPL